MKVRRKYLTKVSLCLSLSLSCRVSIWSRITCAMCTCAYWPADGLIEAVYLNEARLSRPSAPRYLSRRWLSILSWLFDRTESFGISLCCVYVFPKTWGQSLVLKFYLSLSLSLCGIFSQRIVRNWAWVQGRSKLPTIRAAAVGRKVLSPRRANWRLGEERILGDISNTCDTRFHGRGEYLQAEREYKSGSTLIDQSMEFELEF